MLLEASKSSLLVVDVQDRLLPAMHDGARVVARSQIVMKAAQELAVPIAISEQYPKGLGHTVPELVTNEACVFEKMTFSCWRDDAIRSYLIKQHEDGRPQVIVTGIESHVCVLQSCIDLAQAGFAVFAVADAMSSRKPESVALAFDRMRHVGVEVVNAEMVVFELLEMAGTAQFKALSALIR
jgi:nicotinamidase-related amidase